MRHLRIASVILFMVLSIGQLGTSNVQAGQTVYVVQSGDTLSRISQWYSVPISSIAAANGIANPNRIYVGQSLVIPATAGQTYNTSASVNVSVSSGGSTYSVQPGDTLYRIAVRFGTTLQQLLTVNNIANPNLIYPGQSLYVGGTGTAPVDVYAYVRVVDGKIETYASVGDTGDQTTTDEGDQTTTDDSDQTAGTSPSIDILAPDSGKCFNKDVFDLIYFRWTAPTGASWYQLIIYRVEDGAVRYYGPITNAYEVPSTDLFGFGTYQYYLVGFSSEDREVARSDKGTFKISTCTCNGC